VVADVFSMMMEKMRTKEMEMIEEGWIRRRWCFCFYNGNDGADDGDSAVELVVMREKWRG